MYDILREGLLREAHVLALCSGISKGVRTLERQSQEVIQKKIIQENFVTIT